MSHSPPDLPADSPDPSHHAASRPVSYKLMLHHNADADSMRVVRTIMELTRFCVDEATHKIQEAHNGGSSELLVTHRERAELFAEQFTDRGIVVSVERVTDED